MDIVNLTDAPPYDPDSFVAVPFLDGDTCNARVIRLSPGQTLPPHRHEPSELMLFVVEGDATRSPATSAPRSCGCPTRVTRR